MNNIAQFIKTKQSTWFSQWFDTTYYHSLYSNRNETEAANFVDALIEELQPHENASMLDLGCGAGRHAKELARHGYNVIGLDLAASSIREAKRVHVQGLQFYQHDMRLPFCVSRFNYVFSFFTSFGYFKSDEENNEVIKNISMSLRPRGTFVMDYLNVQYSEDNLVPNEQKEIDGIIYNINRWSDNTHFYKKIAIDGQYEFTEQVEKLRLTDFDILFKKNGLKLTKAFGDYKLEPYDPETSPRLIMIAEKE